MPMVKLHSQPKSKLTEVYQPQLIFSGPGELGTEPGTLGLKDEHAIEYAKRRLSHQVNNTN